MNVVQKVKYSIRKEDLHVYEENKHGVNIERWTPFLKKVFSDILDHLESLPAEFKEDHMFVYVEVQSNPTDFERESMYLKIGARANTHAAGYILVFLMRMIIDDAPDLFDWCFESYAGSHREKSDQDWVSSYHEKELDINQMIKALKEHEADSISVTPISEVVKQRLFEHDLELGTCVDNRFSKSAQEIDLWDISRVRAELKKI